MQLLRSDNFQKLKVFQRQVKLMKAEPLLAKLNELRHEAEDDKTDLEYLALHHAFCFLSYKMGEFQNYLNEVQEKGETDT